MDNTELFRTIVNDCADFCERKYHDSVIEKSRIKLFKECSLDHLYTHYSNNGITDISQVCCYSQTKNFLFSLKENTLTLLDFEKYVIHYVPYHICTYFFKESFCKILEGTFYLPDLTLSHLNIELEKYKNKWLNLASQYLNKTKKNISNKSQQSNIKRIAKKVGSKMRDEDENMQSQTTTFWQRTKETAWEESKEVFLRQAAKQFRKTAAVPMIQGLKKFGFDNPLFLGLLQSEQGTAVLGALLGLLAPTLPLPAAGKEFAHALSRELRISGGEAVVDPVVNMVMDPIREIFTEQVKMLMPASSDLQLPEKIEEKPKAAPKKRAPRVKKAKTLENTDITVKEVKKTKEATT